MCPYVYEYVAIGKGKMHNLSVFVHDPVSRFNRIFVIHVVYVFVLIGRSEPKVSQTSNDGEKDDGRDNL